MRHPHEAALHRLLDEPAGVAEADRRHVADCPRCLATLSAGRSGAEPVAAAAGTAVVDVAAAGRRRSTAAPAARPRRAAPPRARRSAALLRRPAVAALAVAVSIAGAGTAAANDWLQIFRTEQVAPLSITTADLVTLPDLGAYGDLAVAGDVDAHEVPDATVAAAESGLDVPEVRQLPRGISGEPTYQVVGRVAATFTFSAARAARAAAEAGEAPPPLPPGLDGAQVRLEAGPGLAAIWSEPAGVPALVVGRAVAPTASSSGVPFETVRDHLLSLPGLPDEVAAQLRTFTADGSTLPLPVPADHVTTTSARVGGAEATVLATRDRSLAAVVWVDGGVVTAVAGALDADEVLSIARDLR